MPWKWNFIRTFFFVRMHIANLLYFFAIHLHPIQLSFFLLKFIRCIYFHCTKTFFLYNTAQLSTFLFLNKSFKVAYTKSRSLARKTRKNRKIVPVIEVFTLRRWILNRNTIECSFRMFYYQKILSNGYFNLNTL